MTSAANETTWIKPVTKSLSDYPVLKLYNSLTRSKVEFIPNDANEVTWYSCGPTVYNPSHMGHARNYVTIDINRRILQDYFNYNVIFIQNVTDIDDKIILKARQEYAFKEFINKLDGKITSELIETTTKSVDEYMKNNLQEFTGSRDEFQAWVKTLDLKEIGMSKPKFPMHVKSILSALEAIEAIKLNEKIEFIDFVDKSKDVIFPMLDKEFGSTVTDPKIFRNCSSFWEREFDSDMKKLNVATPTVTTRVSEYIPEIVKYVEEIIAKGFAYTTIDGSVYFNTSKFDNDANHQYAKCQPWSKGNMELLEDGEGSLTKFEDKQNATDFALWKSSKTGEPSWESPWGFGRPGWHIECSVMASDFVGNNMDIHSGGIDLAFPHHDNEMAQSEAHYNCKQWVNYFAHTGHLHIGGQKMSKSLKNFITIDEALLKYSSRQLRLCFALVQWNNSLDFKESLLNETRSTESTINKFFQKIRALKFDNENSLASGKIISKKFNALEKKLFNELKECKKNVHSSLCDNLSTPAAIRSLVNLINNSNIYINNVGIELKVDLLIDIVYYITKMLKIFGFNIRDDNLGWVDEAVKSEAGGESSSGKISSEEAILPYVKVLSEFRDSVRNISIKKGDYKELLELCDLVRDKDLINLGVSLDDRSDGQNALIKFLTTSEKEELIAQQLEKIKIQELKEKKRQEKIKLEKEKERERVEKSKLSPSEMFRINEYAKLYSEWDEEGLPIKTVDGEEVSKSAKKKLVKLQAQQKKAHDEYLKDN